MMYKILNIVLISILCVIFFVTGLMIGHIIRESNHTSHCTEPQATQESVQDLNIID